MRLATCVALAMLVTVLAAACADAAGWSAVAVDDLTSSDSVTLIDTASNTSFDAVGVGVEPLGIAITPSARTALVVDLGTSAAQSAVTPVDLTTTPRRGSRRSASAPTRPTSSRWRPTAAGPI